MVHEGDHENHHKEGWIDGNVCSAQSMREADEVLP